MAEQTVWDWAAEGRLKDALRDAMDRAPGTVSLSAYIRMTPYLERENYLRAMWPIIKEALNRGTPEPGRRDRERAGDQAIELVG